MSSNSKIEWTDHTFNPWIGCTRISPGCDGCYAAVSTPARAMKVIWGATEPRHRTAPSTWKQPLAWHRGHEAFFAQHGRRQRVFCASLADVFDNAVDPQWREDLFALIRECENLDWLLLTKRIGNVASMLPWKGEAEHWPHVRIGITLTSQAELERDLLKLIALGGPNFVSAEPLLGPLDFTAEYFTKKLGSYPFKGLPSEHRTRLIHLVDWLIVGGESGPHARPMHRDWARSLRDQCGDAGVQFFFKQWGAYIPVSDSGEEIRRVGKEAAGRLLDGREWNGVPS
ncbi:phage Gp37/Gp68 family protein [Variovorax paradoxus]|nr:phage Gp37/Gp68 family protein [Variovorax paradoxus]